MGREIKFRAYHKAWTCEDGMKFEASMEYSEFMEDTWCCDLKDTKRTKVMQGTGIKDKNGKEIYEGDILSIRCWKDSTLNSYYIMCNVIWGYGEWALGENDDLFNNKQGFFDKINPVSLNDVIYDYGSENIENFEIKGNIYENPNLI